MYGEQWVFRNSVEQVTSTALLTKEDLLNASQQEPTAHSDGKRMVGGDFLDSLKSVFKWVTNPNNRKQIGSVIRSGMDVHDAFPGKKPKRQSEKSQGLDVVQWVASLWFNSKIKIKISKLIYSIMFYPEIFTRLDEWNIYENKQCE